MFDVFGKCLRKEFPCSFQSSLSLRNQKQHQLFEHKRFRNPVGAHPKVYARHSLYFKVEKGPNTYFSGSGKMAIWWGVSRPGIWAKMFMFMLFFSSDLSPLIEDFMDSAGTEKPW